MKSPDSSGGQPEYPLREQWLQAAVEELREDFEAVGAPLPRDVRVSTGWSRPARRTTRGQCWARQCANDGVNNIFISPAEDKPVNVLEVLVHELVHAQQDCRGHGRDFGRVARALGLVGRLTATFVGPELEARLNEIAAVLGPYPHGALRLLPTAPQNTRLIKVSCPCCGYIARTTRYWLDRRGPPLCQDGEAMVEE